jgi:hypothetical protein
MLKNFIDLNQATWNTAGHVTVAEDNSDPGRPWNCRERDRLLNLVYFVSYTKAGRALLWSEVPAGGKTPAQVRTNLTTKIRALFPTRMVHDQEPNIADEPTLTDAEVNLVIDAHLAAHAYKDADAAGDQDAMKEAREQFIVASRFVTDALYEASMGHIISMVW